MSGGALPPLGRITELSGKAVLVLVRERSLRIEKQEGGYMNSVKVDMDACTGCGTCYDACFVNVFRWDGAMEKPIVAYLRIALSVTSANWAAP